MQTGQLWIWPNSGGYCLNPQHRRGQHKARVFAGALGLTADDAEFLQNALLEAVQQFEAVPTEAIAHGQLYVLDFPVQGTKR